VMQVQIFRRHSGAMRQHRTMVRNCAPEHLDVINLWIPGSRFARPGMTAG